MSEEIKNITWHTFKTYRRDLLDLFYMNRLNECQKRACSVWWESFAHGFLWVIKYPVVDLFRGSVQRTRDEK